ncbi:MAG TPA: hypothetical protein DCY94_03780 [Firmicutes bacterium]|nr:hypothetical protein [Bacillota bacterium]
MGSDFLNVTFTYQKFKVMLGPLRFAFIYFYYIKMPSIVYFLSSIMPSNAFTILIKFTILLGVLIFYIWNVVHLLTKKEMFYDRLFKMQVESTIKD